jgi:hypothetical protein
MPYKVFNEFRDKEDNNTLYQVGEEYPKGDYKPTKNRIKELSKEHSKYKKAFIEEVKEENPQEPLNNGEENEDPQEPVDNTDKTPSENKE